MPATAPKALIFDVFGTVVDWRTGVAQEVAAAFAAKGIDADPVAFAVAWRAEYQPGMQRVRSGQRGYVPLDELHFENLGHVLDRFGLGDAFDTAERWALNTAWEKLPPWPDAVSGLMRLKAGFIVAPCSNGSMALMTRLAKFGALPWDCILGADVAQGYKPDPVVYRRSAAALRLASGEVMMVAAHNDDLAAARAGGMLTAFVPRPAEHGPDQRSDLAPASDWDIVAEDFGSLAERLGR